MEHRHCRSYGLDKLYSDLTFWPLAVTFTLEVWTCVWYKTHHLVIDTHIFEVSSNNVQKLWFGQALQW